MKLIQWKPRPNGARKRAKRQTVQSGTAKDAHHNRNQTYEDGMHLRSAQSRPYPGICTPTPGTVFADHTSSESLTLIQPQPRLPLSPTRPIYCLGPSLTGMLPCEHRPDHAPKAPDSEHGLGSPLDVVGNSTLVHDVTDVSRAPSSPTTFYVHLQSRQLLHRTLQSPDFSAFAQTDPALASARAMALALMSDVEIGVASDANEASAEWHAICELLTALKDESRATSDQLLASIAIMALGAEASGDMAKFCKHMAGLLEILAARSKADSKRK